MICEKCKGTGLEDSGGVTPWGETIMVQCSCGVTLQPSTRSIDPEKYYERKFYELLEAEHNLSASYVRLRQIVGAMDLPEGITTEQRWEFVEQKAREMRQRSQALEDIARDFVRRNANGPLFYRDLYNRFKEALGD